jgi:hypothetical protein
MKQAEHFEMYFNVAIFWDIGPCSPYVNWCSSETSDQMRIIGRYIPDDDYLKLKTGNELW